MHRIQCIEYDTRIQCIEYNAKNIIHRPQCILLTMHILHCKAKNTMHEVQYIEYMGYTARYVKNLSHLRRDFAIFVFLQIFENTIIQNQHRVYYLNHPFLR